MDGKFSYENGIENTNDTQRRGVSVEQGATDDPAMEKHRGRGGRCRRRSQRKKDCRCKSSRRKRIKQFLSRNPFIIFYLEMYFKMPGKRVAEVAREAGKKWCALSEQKKAKYVRLAEKVKKRCRMRRRRH